MQGPWETEEPKGADAARDDAGVDLYEEYRRDVARGADSVLSGAGDAGEGSGAGGTTTKSKKKGTKKKSKKKSKKKGKDKGKEKGKDKGLGVPYPSDIVAEVFGSLRDGTLQVPPLASDELPRYFFDHGWTLMLFHRYRVDVLRGAKSVLACESDAEDMVQKVYLLLMTGGLAIRVRQEGALHAFFYTVGRRQALKYVKQRSRRRALLRTRYILRTRATSGTYGIDPSLALERVESCERVRQAMETLSPRDQQILELRYVQGLRHAEIAQILGISEEASRTALRRAVIRLQHAMGELSGLYSVG